MRLLGLDVGDRTIGVALSDETATLASGLHTIRRADLKRDLREVLGAPLTPDERLTYEGQLVQARSQLDGETFAAAWRNVFSATSAPRVFNSSKESQQAELRGDETTILLR